MYKKSYRNSMDNENGTCVPVIKMNRTNLDIHRDKAEVMPMPMTEMMMGQPLTFEKTIDGKGTVQVFGKLDLDKFIQRLLSSKALLK